MVMKEENLVVSRGREREKRLLRRKKSTTWIFYGFGNDRFAVGNGSAKRLVETKSVGESSVERLGLGKPTTASLEMRKIEDRCGCGSPCWYLG
jgi:hypothetical protein